LQTGTPVRQNGLSIGTVTDVLLDEKEGGVLVVVDIEEKRRLRVDSQPVLVRTLLGDSSIEFSPGAKREFLPPNTKVEGVAPADPMQIIHRLERQVTTTLTAFEETSREWQKVGSNVNALVETNQGDLDDIIERAALALQQFTHTMQTANVTLTEANHILADPQLQQDLKATVAALPQMVNETRETISAARLSVQKIGENLDNLSQATDPLAEHSRSMVVKLDGSLGQLESLLTELNSFAKMVNTEDGSLQRFAGDPALADQQDPLHPAVVRSIAAVIDAGHATNTHVAVCGEMGGDPAGSVVLAGLGVDELSMEPTSFGPVKRALGSVLLEEAREVARGAAAARDASTARRLVDDLLAARAMES